MIKCIKIINSEKEKTMSVKHSNAQSEQNQQALATAEKTAWHCPTISRIDMKFTMETSGDVPPPPPQDGPTTLRVRVW
jgi:hypothetical protein